MQKKKVVKIDEVDLQLILGAISEMHDLVHTILVGRFRASDYSQMAEAQRELELEEYF